MKLDYCEAKQMKNQNNNKENVKLTRHNVYTYERILMIKFNDFREREVNNVRAINEIVIFHICVIIIIITIFIYVLGLW